MSERKETNRKKVKTRFLRLKRDDEISRRELLKLAVQKNGIPFGKLEIDGARCTRCGLCASGCPAGALISSTERDTFGIAFNPELCNACNLCVEVCPEKCLSLVRVLEPEKIDKETKLIEDEFVRCRNCGGIVAPKAMIEKLRERLEENGSSLLGLELCPECKTGQLIKQV